METGRVVLPPTRGLAGPNAAAGESPPVVLELELFRNEIRMVRPKAYRSYEIGTVQMRNVMKSDSHLPAYIQEP